MAKQKNRYSDGQQSLFEDMTASPVIPQKTTKNKPHTSPNINNTAHKPGGDRVPKGRKPVFVVDETIRLKYPFIRHQPAVLMDYRNVVDIIVRDGNNEFWLGVDRHGNEILPGSFERKIPDHLKESVIEYIDNLKIV